jgi:hypothetical protein
VAESYQSIIVPLHPFLTYSTGGGRPSALSGLRLDPLTSVQPQNTAEEVELYERSRKWGLLPSLLLQGQHMFDDPLTQPFSDQHDLRSR